MKNIIISFVSFLFLTGVAQAFSPAGEEMVSSQSIPIHSYNPATGEDMSASVNRLSHTVKGTRKDVGTVKKSIRCIKTDITGIRSAVTSIAKSDEEIAQSMQETKSMFKTEAKNLGEQAFIISCVLGGMMILLGFVVIVRSNKARCHTIEAIQPVIDNGNKFVARTDQLTDAVNDVSEAMSTRADELLAEVRSGFAEMRTSFTELPAKVATAVNTLDASAFEFEATGHDVTYQSPKEGIADGYYLLLHVPKNMTGNVATYERAHETNRGLARRNCRKTMQMYFEGKFDAPEYALQKELIGYLISTGELLYIKNT